MSKATDTEGQRFLWNMYKFYSEKLDTVPWWRSLKRIKILRRMEAVGAIGWADIQAREDILDQDWGKVWDSLPDAPPLKGRPRLKGKDE